MLYFIIGQLVVVTVVLGYLSAHLSTVQKHIGLLMKSDISQIEDQEKMLRMLGELMEGGAVQMKAQKRYLQLHIQIVKALDKLMEGGNAQLNSGRQILYMLESLIKKGEK